MAEPTEESPNPSEDRGKSGGSGGGTKDGAALRTELNQLWKTTVNQFDEMKDILVRSSSAGKAKIEVTLLRRQQEKLFSELGELIYSAREKEDLLFPDSCTETLKNLDRLHDEISNQQEEFDRFTSQDDDSKDASAAPPTDVDAGPPPDVVDAKDPPPS